MNQAPPTDPAPSLLGLDESERTMVSKGPRHASEFQMEEEENFPTLQMEGAQVSNYRDVPSEVDLAHQLFDDQDRTQVNLYNQETPGQSADMWRTPSQDAWNSPFPQGYGQQSQGWNMNVGVQDPQPTYSGPLDIARAAGAEPPERRRSRLLWWLLVLVIAGGGFVAAYVYLLPMLQPKKKIERKVFVVMELETTPKGATVWVDGRRQLEPTPTAISVRIGRTVQIQLRKKDYKTIDFQWQATAYDRRQFFLQSMVPPRPQPREVDPPVAALKQPVRERPVLRRARTPRRARARKPRFPSAVLYIRTVPSGAKVRVDEKIWPGKTPLRIVLRQGRKARITVQKYGHQDAFFVWSADRNENHTIKLYRHSWYNP